MSTSTAGIGKGVVHSTAWLYGRRLLSSFFSLFVTALLSRKLAPADFGTVALASVVMNMLATVGPYGVGSFIVYDRAEGREDRAHAAFWLSQLLTLLATAIGLVLTPVAARYYGTSQLGPILNVLILQFALSQLTIIPDALIQKVLNFKKLVLRDSVLEIIAGGAMVAMAYSGYGVWSLIIPSLIVVPFRVILTFRLAHWLPKLPLRTHLWPQILRYVSQTTASGLVNFLADNGDTMIVGKTLGSTDLGLYNRAWGSANMVSKNVTRVVSTVAMPALSAVSSDAARLRAAMSRMLRMLGLASFPLLIGLFIVADLFVQTVYGPQWQRSVVPLQILMIYALRHAVGSPSTVIYQVVGRPDVAFKMGMIFLPFYALSIWVGSFYGIIGVAIGVTASRTIYGMIQFLFVARLIGQTYWKLINPMGQPLTAACAMGCIVALARVLLDRFQLPAPVELVTLTLIGGITWVVLLARLFPGLLEEGMTVTDHFPREISMGIRNIVKPLMA